MSNSVEQATKALWDYINGLEPEQRAKAIAYQFALEHEAARTDGGMTKVIEQRVLHASKMLSEALEDLLDEFGKHVTSVELDRIKNLK